MEQYSLYTLNHHLVSCRRKYHELLSLYLLWTSLDHLSNLIHHMLHLVLLDLLVLHFHFLRLLWYCCRHSCHLLQMRNWMDRVQWLIPWMQDWLRLHRLVIDSWSSWRSDRCRVLHLLLVGWVRVVIRMGCCQRVIQHRFVHCHWVQFHMVVHRCSVGWVPRVLF